MRIFLEITSCLLFLSAGGTYLYFHAEQLLDELIEFQKKVRGGFYRTANPNERCPACGAKNGTIFYTPETQRLMHTCNVCNASWPEKPRIPSHAWDLVGKTMQANQDQIADVREIFERANKPVIKNKKEAA
jgi:hypothetical protein